MGHNIQKWEYEPERKKVRIEHDIRIREVNDGPDDTIRIIAIVILIGLIGSAIFGG